MFLKNRSKNPSPKNPSPFTFKAIKILFDGILDRELSSVFIQRFINVPRRLNKCHSVITKQHFQFNIKVTLSIYAMRNIISCSQLFLFSVECSQLAGRNEKRRRVRGGRNYVAQVHLQYRKIFHSIYFKPVHCKDAHMRFCSHKNGNPIHCAR